MEFNAGEIVELAVRRKNVNISELSKRLHVNRRTLYNWFGKEKLHMDLILEIGKAINYNFSNDFQIEQICVPDNKDLNISKKGDDTDHSSTALYWMEKYIALLEDYKNLALKEQPQRV